MGKAPQRVFDIEEYAAKARAALAKLKESQRPGQQTGKGGKSDVLLAVKDEVTKMMDEGYSVKQIAEAFQTDVFGILPKTITELFGKMEKPRKTKGTQRVGKQTTGQEDAKASHNTTGKGKTRKEQELPQRAASVHATSKATTKAPGEAGGFTVKEDSSDL